MASGERSWDTSSSDEWDEPTVIDGAHPTGPHDLTLRARLSLIDDREALMQLAYSEGHEDAIRALYADMRATMTLAQGQMDQIAASVRSRFTQL